MPLSGRDAVILCVLVCCVPVQYWLTQRSPITPDQRVTEVYRLAEQARTMVQKWFTIASWKEWVSGVQKYMTDDYSLWYILDDDNPMGECPAVEVWNYLNPEGSFGMSPKPRYIHPQGVKWRIGQVVKHNLWGYKAVIIGWDIKSKAPEEWIHEMHQGNKQHWRDQPNYALLVDTGDRDTATITYVPQENISPVVNTEVKHPDLSQYFDFFDGAQYIPCPWLRAIYPSD